MVQDRWPKINVLHRLTSRAKIDNWNTEILSDETHCLDDGDSKHL
jgi:hypothetical protein